MDKQNLLHRLEAMLDTAAREGRWGSITIELQRQAVRVVETKSTKLQFGEQPNGRETR